jgi:hypothetical protein
VILKISKQLKFIKMKKISILLGVAAMVIMASCNNQSADSNKSKEMKMDEMKDMKMDSMKMDDMKMDSASHKQHQVMDSSMKK